MMMKHLGQGCGTDKIAGTSLAWVGVAILAARLSIGPAAAEVHAERIDPRQYRVETLSRSLDHPWSLAHLPDGRRLVTERPGRLRVIEADGRLRPEAVSRLPPMLHAGRTGLMEVSADPDFARTEIVYLTYAYGTPGANNTRLARGRLVDNRLEDVRILFSATPKAGLSHYGGRIAWLPDGTLVLSLGDAFDRREDAQDLSNHLGKIVRLTREGVAPADNPFVGRAGAAPEILSLGHRNVQGIAFDPSDRALLVSEHGPRGGDEINRIRPGANYGWPLVTDGLDYTFARVSPYRDLPGFERPLLVWTPSIAPAGLAIYDASLFSGWTGDLLVPALVEKGVRRVRRSGGRIVSQQLFLTEIGARIRDVRVAPDGAIEALTDEAQGRLLRITPAHP